VGQPKFLKYTIQEILKLGLETLPALGKEWEDTLRIRQGENREQADRGPFNCSELMTQPLGAQAPKESRCP